MVGGLCFGVSGGVDCEADVVNVDGSFSVVHVRFGSEYLRRNS